MEKSFCFCGLSTFGYRAACSLHAAGKRVLAIDRDADVIQSIRDLVDKAVCADLRHREVLKAVGALECDAAIVALPTSFDVAILTVHYLRQEGMRRIIAEVESDEAEAAIKVVGAHEVVFPERDAADRVVRSLVTPGLVDHHSLTPESGLLEIQCPDSFFERTLVDLRLRERFDVYVLGVKRVPDGSPPGAPPVLLPPLPSLEFRAGDTLITLGNEKNLARFAKEVAG
jgi:trk system potassium uptake protein TrkA